MMSQFDIDDHVVVKSYFHTGKEYHHLRGTIFKVYVKSVAIKLDPDLKVPIEFNGRIAVSKKELIKPGVELSPYDGQATIEEQQILELIDYGYSQREISSGMGIPVSRVSNVRKKFGKSIRTRYTLKAIKEDNILYFESYKDLAVKWKLSDSISRKAIVNGWQIKRGCWHWGEIMDKKQIASYREASIQKLG